MPTVSRERDCVVFVVCVCVCVYLSVCLSVCLSSVCAYLYLYPQTERKVGMEGAAECCHGLTGLSRR